MPKGTNYDLVCPQCGEICFETTESFDSERYADAGMFKLKRQFTAAEGNQWDGFPPDPTAGYGLLECVQCGGAYAPSGRVIVRTQEVTPEEAKEIPCPHCERSFKSQEGLKAHIRLPHVPPIIRQPKDSGMNLDGLEAETKEIWECPYCPSIDGILNAKGFESKEALQDHMELHEKKAFIDPLPTMKSLIEHLDGHHPDDTDKDLAEEAKEEKPFYDVADEIDKTLEEVSSEDPTEPVIVKSENKLPPPKVAKDTQDWVCPDPDCESDKTFKTQQALNAHMRMHKKG